MTEIIEKNAIFYGRVSDPKQAEKELPIASQLEAGHKKAHQLGARIVKTFLDEGLSGRRDNRPAFQDAILYAEIEQPTYFIIWSSSRFARNKLDAAFYKKKLETAGVQLIYVSMEIDTSTNEGWLLDGVFELFDELTSRQISSDTRRSLLKNARDGFWNGGRLPYGFVAVPDAEKPKRKRLSHNPDEIDILRNIFDLKATHGLGCRQIAIWLNDRQIFNRGARWTKSTISNLLRNEAVIGKTVFGRRDMNGRIKPRDTWTIIDTHEPLISIELWNLVQEKMDKDADAASFGSPHSHRYFTGLLKCGECGAPMHTESAKGRSKRYWYYNCSAAKEGRHKPRRIPADVFDDWLIDELCQQVFTRDTILEIINELHHAVETWLVDKSKRRESVVRRLRSLRAAQNNLYSVLEEFGKNAPNLGDMTQRLRYNNEQMRIAEQQLRDIEAEKPPRLNVNSDDIRRLTEDMNDLVRSVDVQTARTFFGSFVQRIRLMSDHVRFEYIPERLVNRPDLLVPSKEIWLPDKSVLGTRSIKLALPQKLIKIAA